MSKPERKRRRAGAAAGVELAKVAETQSLVDARTEEMRAHVESFCASVAERKKRYSAELQKVMAVHPREAGPGVREKSLERDPATVPPLLRRAPSKLYVDEEAPPGPPSPAPRPADAPPRRKPLPDNSCLLHYMHIIKGEAAELHQIFNHVSDFLMSFTPEIKDEDNFGVEVQENVLSEMAAMIVATGMIRDQQHSYLIKRGELEGQLYKHLWAPTYPRVVRTLDMCYWDTLEKSWRDLIRCTLLAYQALTLNQEKLFEPRREAMAGYY